MVADDLVDDEAQKLLAEYRVEARLLGERPQSSDLHGLAVGVSSGETNLGLVLADALGDLEAFS